MAIKTDSQGTLFEDEIGTGYSDDWISVPWAKQLVVLVVASGGAVIGYIERSLDGGVTWTGSLGTLFNVDTTATLYVIEAPVGLIRAWISTNTSTGTNIRWLASAPRGH